MAKKKANCKVLGYLPLLAALLGVVAVAMIFCPAVVHTIPATYVTEEIVTKFSGLQVTFGHSVTETIVGGLSHTTEYFAFSFMNLLPYILLLVGVVASVLVYLKKDKIAALVALVCFLAAAVLSFFVCGFVQLPENSVVNKEYLSLGVGAIIAAISSILAMLTVAANAVLNK